MASEAGQAGAAAMLLPWHSEQWRQLVGRWRGGRLPHALLCHGPPGTGKTLFARLVAQALLCQRPLADGQPCRTCPPCRWCQAGTHPELLEVVPEEEGAAIKVDQIRFLIGFMALKGQGYKVALVVPAQNMNVAAANSLLKTLEEPPPQALLLLVTSQPAALPPTVRSRCQRLAFPRTLAPSAVAWVRERVGATDAELLLALCGGAPLAAVEWARRGTLAQRRALFMEFQQLPTGPADPVGIAAGWAKLGARGPLHWMLSWVSDMIRLKCAAPGARVENPDLQSGLEALAARLDLQRLYGYLDQITEALQLVGGPSNINVQMLLEGLLIAWTDLGNRERGA